MKDKEFPFLEYLKWLYHGAVGVGILFVLYGFLQDYLVEKIMRLPGKIQILAFFAGIVFFVYILFAVTVYVISPSLIIRGILLAVQVVSFIVLVFLEKPIPVWCVSIILTAVLLFLVELKEKNKKEVLSMLPLFAAAMLLLCFFPSKEEPMDWTWAKNVYVNMKEKAEMLLVDVVYLFEKEDDFPFAGYGNTGNFGGSVFHNDNTQLHITGSGTKNPLYLTGKVYEVYTGEDWDTLPYTEEEMAACNIETALEQSIYADRKEELTSLCLIDVEYRFIRTTDFFHELNTQTLHGDIPKFKEGELWTMKRSKGKGFTYQLCFLEINESSEEIKAFYRQQAWKKGAVWDEKLSEQETEIYQTYTALPDVIPQRVYDLANKLAAEEENDYDRMQSFAEYLKDYTYSQTPPACPAGQEFTDYFLFEGKSGYCSHFATAMAVMGRCVGIPTRYVRGFMTADTCKRDLSDVPLSENRAHAWTEFYIEHVGWVRIDATPGYHSKTVNRWNAEGITGAGQGEKAYFQTELPQEFSPEKLSDDFAWQEEIIEKETDFKGLLKGVAAILLICILLLVLLFFRQLIRHQQYVRADELGKLQRQLKRLLRLGRLQGVMLADSETLMEYQERAKAVLDTTEYSFMDMCVLYERIRFGGKSISMEELQRMEAYSKEVEHKYLAGCGVLKRLSWCFWM